MTICNTESCKEQGYYNFPTVVENNQHVTDLSLCVVVDSKKLFCKNHRLPGMICMSIKMSRRRLHKTTQL